MKRLTWSILVACLALAPLGGARAGYEREFPTGSLIIPMDLAYQDSGMLQAYGLLFQLLRQGVHVYWVIDLDKSWHHADCDTVGDECAWDCAEEGSGEKCPYPTGSPDFYAGATVLWNSAGPAAPGEAIVRHGYRGGPFVVDAAERDAALAIAAIWNDPALWAANPWADRTVFHVVSVHEATAAFRGYVRKEMLSAPTLAVFSDGNENIATLYLRAAGIPQSNGREFPGEKCDRVPCGPGTENPDMLTVPSVMGDMGTCDAPNLDHKNGALFTADGVPAYCQIMSMHWAVDDRETVQCGGGACPASQAECAGEAITYHGHEVVAEVRQFLAYPVHFFAECQAVNAYENTQPNPAWPFLDDAGRDGHFLTTTGLPPDCPCADGDFTCVAGGCDQGARDCCLPRDAKERGAGFLIATQPASDTLKILHPETPYNQLDGAFETTGGSEPAYNLSAYLNTAYKNDIEVTMITGPDGPGKQDVWMTGYLDGECDIIEPFKDGKADCGSGKVSYLGGHDYSVDVPLSARPSSQGARLFLNALFEADCVTSAGQPDLRLALQGPTRLRVPSLPATGTYTGLYLNDGAGSALDAALLQVVPADAAATGFEPGGQAVAEGVSWSLGSIGSTSGQPGDPPAEGSRWTELRFDRAGEYQLELRLSYRVGVSALQAEPARLTVRVEIGEPLDGGDDGEDGATGDGEDAATSDGDGGGGDGSAEDGADGGADEGGGPPAADDCGCASGPGVGPGLWLLGLLALALVRRR